MRNMIKITIKCLIMIILTCSIWIFLSPFFRVEKNMNGDYFRNLPKDSIDILVLGSSQAQYSYNPAVAYAENGFYSYVFGSPCQPVSISYEFLVEALKTQKPEVVLLDVFTLLPDSSVCESDGMYYTAVQQMTGCNKLRAANYVEDEKTKLDYMFDLRMNHGNWKTMDFKIPKIEKGKIEENMGHVPLNPTEYVFRPIEQFEPMNEYKLKEKDLKALENIVDLCRKNDIKLMLYKAPFIIDQENEDALNAVWEFAKANQVEYFDFIELSEKIGFGIGMDGDTWHNTSIGAEKVTKYLSTYISENDYVNSHKDSKKIKNTLETMKIYTAEQLMKEQIDIYKLLEHSSKYPNTLLIKYDGRYRTTLSDFENEILNDAGISHDFINNKNRNFYAIIENGKLLEESRTEINTVVNGHQIVITKNQIKIDDTVIDDLGELEIVFCANDFKWFNPIDIDYASRYFWKNNCNGYICS